MHSCGVAAPDQLENQFRPQLKHTPIGGDLRASASAGIFRDSFISRQPLRVVQSLGAKDKKNQSTQPRTLMLDIQLGSIDASDWTVFRWSSRSRVGVDWSFEHMCEKECTCEGCEYLRSPRRTALVIVSATLFSTLI